ncbi:MAG: mechanosensitive ion channel family protein [Gemmatimonadota bacterium]|nr:MAG: mechanosensitive ion channel family protein [Gemmatimonadota bacterium]
MNLTWSEIQAIAIPAAIAVLGFVVGLVVRRTVMRKLSKVADATRTVVDDVVLAAVHGPVVMWFMIAGLYAAVQITTLPERITALIQQLLLILVIFSITWAVARIVAALVENGAKRAPETLPGATLVTNLARITVLAIGILVILQTLGISIAPIITALGVGGLAVALALQDTLANLFAGVHILVSRQLRPGDYVKLDSGEEGYVMDVTWRQTTIRQLPNNIIIVPNKQIASTITTNYHLPEQELSVLVPVGVHYDSDLEHVERVTIEVAKQTLETVEGGVPSWEPFIRYAAFADSSINFNVILRGQEYVSQYLLKHEFIKRLHKRYEEEGIVIPFPIRTVVMQDGLKVATG